MRSRTLFLLAFALSVLFLAPASAADESRKIDFTTVLMDANGEAMFECTPPDDKSCTAKTSVTLGIVAMRALAAYEAGLSADESLKRGQLALSVYKASAAALTVEEIGTIKKVIAKSWSPVVVARTFVLLDPAVAPPK